MQSKQVAVAGTSEGSQHLGLLCLGISSSTVSPGNLELSFMYVQWSQSVTLFPMIEAGKFIAPQALLAFGHHLRHRAALKRLAQDHRDALANLR